MAEAKSGVNSTAIAPDPLRDSAVRHPEPPVETDGICLTQPARIAAGLKSVVKAIEFTLKEPGLIRGVAALSHLNQFDGIDCPGCAWPAIPARY